ncbi:helix-turn-helix transcriptional regulator [Streptomyces sp. NBC_00893]|uniref:helix-turn-helix transcriptional regulator n=1 Tax=Streptomyces sp. NBC_00893 TaxID=2975862 RepID=UPI00225054B7|nr:AraC family transcriptional regulator [Streptomyces sp. NBC_00893]MCX4849527.1 AraC family transcriptional regulator [Streptomyces sp. NBC_00893]
MESVVQCAVDTIRERYSEPLTLDDLADAASVSKFHFLRVFSRVVGVTPGRYLSAVRLYEAKRLLSATKLTVAEVSERVGYGSPGSFARRFTESVGMSPTQYRRLDRGELPACRDGFAEGAATGCGSLSGTVLTDGGPAGVVYVGAFDSPILQGHPRAWTALRGPGSFVLKGVPSGSWYVHALACGADVSGTPGDAEEAVMTDAVGPVVVEGPGCGDVELTLRTPRWSCPPVLSALPFVEAPLLAAG